MDGMWPRSHPPAESLPVDPLLNVVSALARSEFDDPKVREIVLVKGILLDDGFDLPTTLADGQNDSAISRYFPARDQEIAGSVVLLQEQDMRGHVRVNFGEIRLIDQLNDEHSRPTCMNPIAA